MANSVCQVLPPYMSTLSTPDAEPSGEKNARVLSSRKKPVKGRVEGRLVQDHHDIGQRGAIRHRTGSHLLDERQRDVGDINEFRNVARPRSKERSEKDTEMRPVLRHQMNPETPPAAAQLPRREVE